MRGTMTLPCDIPRRIGVVTSEDKSAMTPVALAELPRWSDDPVDRLTYPARLAQWRLRYAPRLIKDVSTQRYRDLRPVVPVEAWRQALQGVE